MNILANIISLTIVFAVPLMLVALGGMYSEHSGVINLALEGIMVIGALCACFCKYAGLRPFFIKNLSIYQI